MTEPTRERAWRPVVGEPAWHLPTAQWALVREIDTTTDPADCRVTLGCGTFVSCPASALQPSAPHRVSPAQLRLALDTWRAHKLGRPG